MASPDKSVFFWAEGSLSYDFGKRLGVKRVGEMGNVLSKLAKIATHMETELR